MKALTSVWVLLLVLVVFPSCEAIGDIFQAGVSVGIFIVVVVVALIIWLVSRFRK